nr:MAG TPA: hypothetical protein [Caudoviricetes sp.]
MKPISIVTQLNRFSEKNEKTTQFGTFPILKSCK